MKTIRHFTVAVGLVFCLATLAVAQTYFADDFEDSKESEKKWVDLWGAWDLDRKSVV